MNKKITTALTLGLLSQGLFAETKPNIIVFLVDDMGLMDTSCPFITDGNGVAIKQQLNNWYHTPNMERLANRGIRFSNFYACTVSSPSRCTLMTGESSTRHHTTNWINPTSNNRTKYGPTNWNWKGLRKDQMTLPRLLEKNGYDAIHVGKAHFGSLHSDGANPINVGFEVNIAGGPIGHPGSYYSEDEYGAKKKSPYAVPGLEKYYGTKTFLTEALTIEAKKQIKEATLKKEPFFLYMAHYAVHAPFMADPRFVERYQNRNHTKAQVAFATLIEGMDKSLGDLMDYLDQLEIADNTLIIFAGDNGSDSPNGPVNTVASSAPLRGRKGTKWEGGIRVPFIMAWAKKEANNKWQQKLPIKENAIQEQMGALFDIYPTITELLDIKNPKGMKLDGMSLKEEAMGLPNKHREDIYLSNFPHAHNNSYFTTYRHGDWKIIYDYKPEDLSAKKHISLYNLKLDRDESHDVSMENPKITKRLFKEMVKDLKRKEAQYPEVGGKIIYPTLDQQ